MALGSDVVSNLVAGALSGCAVGMASWGTRRIRRRTWATFFGLTSDQSVRVVLNSDPTVASGRVTHNDAAALIRLGAIAGTSATELLVEDHQAVRQPPGEVTEFCIGGPDSNPRSTAHLRTFLPDVTFTPWSPSDPERLAISVGDRVYRYVKGSIAYAIVGKFATERSRPLFLVTGQTSLANLAAVSLLQHSKGMLRRRHRNGAFAYVVRIRETDTYGAGRAEIVEDITSQIAGAPTARSA